MIGLDLDRLAAYLHTGPLTGELIAGGKSNLTYKVTSPGGPFIVRRPPLGHVLATAHDMSREHRIITALGPTEVPVPQTIALCTEESVVGAPFYVMEFVPGNVYRTAAETAALGLPRLSVLASELMRVLAALHAVDPVEVGLADYGRAEGYLERQLIRWHKQLDASRSRPLPGIDELHDRLVAQMPASKRLGIVHGDYRLDNAIVTDDDRVAAVLDWEMSTLGDQLTDLGLLLMYWELLVSGRGLFGSAPPGAQFPPGEFFSDAYARASGTDLSDLHWYVAFANYKLAVIAEGIFFRYQAGQTVGEGFAQVGDGVPHLIERGHFFLSEQ